MSQSSSGESSNPSLKPALRVALGSLDVQLDAELARYRRLSKAAKPFKPPIVGTPKSSNDGVKIAEGILPELSPVVPEKPSIEPETEPQPPTLDRAEPDSPPVPPQPELPSAIAQAATQPTQNGTASLPQFDPSPTSVSASTDTQSTESASSSTEPKDYLESSEELLKTTGNPIQTDQSRSGNGLMSVLGIGSVLLFLLATATLGYAIFKPASVARFLGRSPQTETADATADDAPKEADELPTSPDLSKEEFKDLELDNLGSVNPSPTPVPRPAPAAPPTASSTAGSTSTLNNLDRVLDPNANPTDGDSTNENSTATPSPNATPDPNPDLADVPKPPVDVDDRYYDFHFVVVEYDPQAWEKVRETVPDAYLREFPVGERIQAGAFDTDEEAQQLIERLKAQGIDARVYQAE